MACLVCGKDLGFWQKVGGHAEVCKGCAEQGRSRLGTLVTSVGCATRWHQQHAERWLSQCDEIVRKYRIPAEDGARARNEILSSLFKLLELQGHLEENDLNFLVGLGQRYDLGHSGSPEVKDAILTISLRHAIQSWEDGDPPRAACNALILSKGEMCHWEEPAGLLIQRTKREYVGGYGSVSIPLNVVRGARVRIGGFKGVPIDKTVHEEGGAGVLHITNQRICFTGPERAVVIPYKKIVSMGGFDGGFELQTQNEKKPGIFLVPHPELTTELVKLAAYAKDHDNQRPRRSKELSSP